MAKCILSSLLFLSESCQWIVRHKWHCNLELYMAIALYESVQFLWNAIGSKWFTYVIIYNRHTSKLHKRQVHIYSFFDRIHQRKTLVWKHVAFVILFHVSLLYFLFCFLFFFSCFATEIPEGWGENREPVAEGVTFFLKYIGSTLVEEIENDETYGDGISAKAVHNIILMVSHFSLAKSCATHNLVLYINLV